jgi:hypothetical protein
LQILIITQIPRSERGICNLYAVSSRQRVFEYADLGRQKSEDHKEQRDSAKCYYCFVWRITAYFFLIKQPRFVDVSDCVGNEEDSNVYPIGRLSDRTVVRVEDHGDQDYPKKDPAELHAPEILALAKEKALNYSKNEHRQK